MKAFNHPLAYFKDFDEIYLFRVNYDYLAYSNIFITLTLHIMQKGTVKFFNGTKGFGFITPEDGGEDIFVHTTGLIDQIRENDKVTFEVENGKKGLNAVKVQVA